MADDRPTGDPHGGEPGAVVLPRVATDEPVAVLLVERGTRRVVYASSLAEQLAPGVVLPAGVDAWSDAAGLRDVDGAELSDTEHPLSRLSGGTPVQGQAVSARRASDAAREREPLWVVGLPLAEAPGLGDHALVLLLPLRDAEAVAEARAEAQLRDRAVLATGVSFTVADARADDMPLIVVNPAFTRMTGYPPQEVLGRNCRFLQGPETDPAGPAAIRAALDAGEEMTVTLLNHRRDGTPFWNQVSINPIRDVDGVVTHFVGIQHDVTERIEADRDRAAAYRAERLARERLALLAEATSTLAATLDVDESLDRLARLVVPLLADWVAIHLVDAAGGVRQVAVRHRDGHEDLLRRYAELQPRHATEQSPIRRVLAGADALLLEAFGRAAMRAATDSDEVLEIVERLGWRSSMVVPLAGRDRVLGSIAFLSGPSGRVFGTDELQVAVDLGRRAATTVENAHLYEDAREAQARAEQANERLALVGQVTSALVGTLDVEEALRRLATLVVPRLADWCIVNLLDENDRLHEVAARHRDPALAPDVERFAAVQPQSLRTDAGVLEVLRTGEPRFVEGFDEASFRRRGTPELGQLVQRLGAASGLVVPLRAHGRTLGTLGLVNGPDRAPFGAGDLAVASDVGRRAGLAVESAQLYGVQRRASEVLQRSLLTSVPETHLVEIASRYRPAAHEAQVGGDWYDAFLQPDGATILVIGDVVGHDIGAAAAMGQLRNLLRGTAYGTQDDPGEILRRVDVAMGGLRLQTLATAVVVRLDAPPDGSERDRRLCWASAGHPPPMVLRADGGVDVLDEPGDLLLGFDAGVERGDREAVLSAGATLLLYTDGLVERRDLAVDDGIERLRATLAELAGHPLEELCDALLGRLLPDAVDDDVAVLAVRNPG
jgi:PAS domain S-box-containing protein